MHGMLDFPRWKVFWIWALVDCITRPSAAFPLHNKQTKTVWLVILAVAVIVGGLGLLGIDHSLRSRGAHGMRSLSIIAATRS